MRAQGPRLHPIAVFVITCAMGCASPAHKTQTKTQISARSSSEQPLLIRMGGPEAASTLAADWLARIERDPQLGPRVLGAPDREQRSQRLSQWLIAVMEGADLPLLPSPLGVADVPRLADALAGSLERFYIGSRERDDLLQRVRATGRSP